MNSARDTDCVARLADMAAVTGSAVRGERVLVMVRVHVIRNRGEATREDMKVFAEYAPCLIRAIAGAWGIGIRELYALLPLTWAEFQQLVFDGEDTIRREFAKVERFHRNRAGYP